MFFDVEKKNREKLTKCVLECSFFCINLGKSFFEHYLFRSESILKKYQKKIAGMKQSNVTLLF